MATETEVALNVEDFFGVNSQVTSEDIKDQFYKQAQNLYERKLGEIQPIGGCTEIQSTTLPSNVIYIGHPFTLTDRLGGKTRMAHVRTRDSRGIPGWDTLTIAAPNVVGTWGINGTGYWGTPEGVVANAYLGAGDIAIVATGFGVFNKLSYSQAGGYPVSGDSKSLIITISSAFTDTNITGLEVYGQIIVGYTGGNTRTAWMFIGYIDLVSTPTGVFTFARPPITLGADPGAGKVIGSGDATFTLDDSATAGNLTPGKTYYVTMMSQYMNYSAGEQDTRSFYKSSVTTAITLGPTTTSIAVHLTAAASSSTLFAIGTHPDLLRASALTNDATGDYTITHVPENATHINKWFTAADVFKNVFSQSIICTAECFAKYDTTYSRWRPIHISRNAGNKSTTDANYVASMNAYSYYYLRGHEAILHCEQGLLQELYTGRLLSNDISANGDWDSAPYNNYGTDLIYLCSRPSHDSCVFNSTDYDSSVIRSLDDLDNNTSAAGKLFFSDGYVCGRVIPEYGYAVPPRFNHIGVFKESLFGLGGPGDAYNRVYFCTPFHPGRWGTPLTNAMAQYVQVEGAGEGVNGAAVYTNSTATSGPVAQLVISKPNSLWLLSTWPIYSAAEGYTTDTLNTAVMTQLSGEVGSAGHRCFQNTDIGLITASPKGVWLIRESGEPTPIGEEIKNLLVSEDPLLQSVNPMYWHAVFHDGHYKLVYSVDGAINPTKELWLSISKMKQTKGQPCWNGPHTTRSATNGLRFSYRESPFNNQGIPVRIGTTGASKNWGTMDDPSAPLNFKEPITEVQKFTFTGTPTSGNWKITYGTLTTDNIAWNATAATVQTRLRDIALAADQSLSHVTVTGTLATGFSVTMVGITSPSLFGTTGNTLDGGTTIAVTRTTTYAAPAASDMTYIFETRDYPLGNSLLNKLFTRTYWRLRVDQTMDFTEETTTLSETGETTETKTLNFPVMTGHVGGSYTTFLTARQKLYQFFPTLRLRGETIRKKLTYQGQKRFAISGLTLNFRPEGRRPG